MDPPNKKSSQPRPFSLQALRLARTFHKGRSEGTTRYQTWAWCGVWSSGFSRQGVVLEDGSKHSEIHGETTSDRLKPGLHTLYPSLVYEICGLESRGRGDRALKGGLGSGSQGGREHQRVHSQAPHWRANQQAQSTFDHTELEAFSMRGDDRGVLLGLCVHESGGAVRGPPVGSRGQSRHGSPAATSGLAYSIEAPPVRNWPCAHGPVRT